MTVADFARNSPQLQCHSLRVDLNGVDAAGCHTLLILASAVYPINIYASIRVLKRQSFNPIVFVICTATLSAFVRPIFRIPCAPH